MAFGHDGGIVIPSQCAPRSKYPWGAHWRGDPSPRPHSAQRCHSEERKRRGNPFPRPSPVKSPKTTLSNLSKTQKCKNLPENPCTTPPAVL